MLPPSPLRLRILGSIVFTPQDRRLVCRSSANAHPSPFDRSCHELPCLRNEWNPPSRRELITPSRNDPSHPHPHLGRNGNTMNTHNDESGFQPSIVDVARNLGRWPRLGLCEPSARGNGIAPSARGNGIAPSARGNGIVPSPRVNVIASLTRRICPPTSRSGPPIQRISGPKAQPHPSLGHRPRNHRPKKHEG